MQRIRTGICDPVHKQLTKLMEPYFRGDRLFCLSGWLHAPDPPELKRVTITNTEGVETTREYPEGVRPTFFW